MATSEVPSVYLDNELSQRFSGFLRYFVGIDASVTRKLVVPDRVRPLWLRSVPIVDGNIAVVVVKNQVVD